MTISSNSISNKNSRECSQVIGRMASYTELNIDQAQKILALYGIDRIEGIEPISLGISNSNYRVLLKDSELLLKVSNDKNIKQLRQEMQILNYLKNKEFSLCIAPYSTNEGHLVYQEGSFFGVVFPFINGKAPEINGDTSQKVGEALAKLHSITSNRPPSEFSRLRNYKLVGFDDDLIRNYVNENKKCPNDFKKKFNQILLPRLNEISGVNLPSGLIHGDLYYDNALFENGELVTILDFEQSGIATFLLDIGISISGTCLKDGKIDQAQIDRFLVGYEQYRPLLEEEKNLLNTFVLIGLFSISLWRIKRFTEGNLDKSKSTFYRQLIERAEQFESELNSTI